VDVSDKQQSERKIRSKRHVLCVDLLPRNDDSGSCYVYRSSAKIIDQSLNHLALLPCCPCILTSDELGKMRLPTHLITAVLAIALGGVFGQEADIELRQLSDDNFRASTARGMW
jgi:hypothetical protein